MYRPWKTACAVLAGLAMTVAGVALPAPARAAGPAITITTVVGGQSLDSAPGAIVSAGYLQPPTYKISNTGDAPLTAVSVTDPSLPADATLQCPTTTLAVGESTTCWATSGSLSLAAGQQYVAAGTVTADAGAATVSATDTAYAYAPQFTTTVVAEPGTEEVTAADLTVSHAFTVTITNTDSATYSTGPINVSASWSAGLRTSVSVDGVTLVPTGHFTYAATAVTLAPGESYVATVRVIGEVWPQYLTEASWANGLSASLFVSARGAQATGTFVVTGDASLWNGLRVSNPVVGPVPNGSPATLTYTVSNLTAAPLTGIELHDADVPATTYPCSATTIPAGGQITCTRPWTAPATTGTYAVSGVVAVANSDQPSGDMWASAAPMSIVVGHGRNGKGGKPTKP